MLAWVPIGAFWTVAGIVLVLLVGLLVRSNNPVSFPDQAQHLKRLRWGAFAGRPPTDEPSQGSMPQG